ERERPACPDALPLADGDFHPSTSDRASPDGRLLGRRLAPAKPAEPGRPRLESDVARVDVTELPRPHGVPGADEPLLVTESRDLVLRPRMDVHLPLLRVVVLCDRLSQSPLSARLRSA